MKKIIVTGGLGFIGSKYLVEWKGECINPNKEEFIKLLNRPLGKKYRKPKLNKKY